MKEKRNMESGFNFKDYPEIKGILKYKVFKSGVLIEDVEDDNLIVNSGRELMARLLAGEFDGRSITKIAFGENANVPTVNDTEITKPFTKDITGYSFPGIGRVRFDWKLETTEGNEKSILEFGLISEDGALFSRRIRKNGLAINKADDISIEGQWEIIF